MAALLLAADGPRPRSNVIPPPASCAAEAWDSWASGVNQARMLHYFLPLFRHVVEAELLEVAAE